MSCIGLLACIAAGLIGCATFDQKYQRIEIREPDSGFTTSRRGTSAKQEDTGQYKERESVEDTAEVFPDVDATPIEHTTNKPLTTQKARSSDRSSIQLAAFQDPSSQTKPTQLTTESVPLESADQPSIDVPKPADSTVKEILVPDPDIPAGKADVTLPIDPAVGPGDQTLSPGVQLLTLEQAVYETENSFQMQADAERMNQAYSDYTTASLLPNPTISTIASLQPFPGRPFTVTRQGGPPQYDLGINYPFDWLLFGKRKAAMIAAGTWTAVAEAEYQDVLRQRVALTRSTFIDVLEAREFRDLALLDVQNLKQIEAMTVKQVDAGGAGSVVLDRVRVALLNVERDLQIRETTLKNLKSTLRALLGRTEADPDFEVAGTLDIGEPIPPRATEELLAIAQESRPDIQSARRQVDFALNTINSEEKKAKPQFTGTFGLTYQLQEKAIGFPNAGSYGGGVIFSVPLFDRNQGHISKAQSAYTEATLKLQARLSALHAEVDQAATSYRDIHHAVTSTNIEQVKAARSVRDKIAESYDSGGQPLVDVLDAERSFRETTRLLINARATYWKSLYRLNAVTGTNVAP